MRSLYILAIVFSVTLNLLFAGTTGKIVGTVSDARTGEKLVAANVVVQGANLGASTNLDGYFIILNIPPGTYRLRASLVGYTSVTQVDVRVEIDQTTTTNFRMSEETVQAQEVVIVAERPIVQKDISATSCRQRCNCRRPAGGY
jgi:CarboxypepD_reg-like domain